MAFIQSDLEAAIQLIEVLEIKTENAHILQLRRTCYEELEKILQGAAAGWLTGLLLEARKQARGGKDGTT